MEIPWHPSSLREIQRHNEILRQLQPHSTIRTRAHTHSGELPVFIQNEWFITNRSISTSSHWSHSGCCFFTVNSEWKLLYREENSLPWYIYRHTTVAQTEAADKTLSSAGNWRSHSAALFHQQDKTTSHNNETFNQRTVLTWSSSNQTWHGHHPTRLHLLPSPPDSILLSNTTSVYVHSLCFISFI